MMKLGYLRSLIALGALFLALGLTLEAKSKAEKLYQQARTAELKKDWDTAVELYQQAAEMDPVNPQYTIGMRRSRFQAGQEHVNRAQKLRVEGKLQEALGEFQKALIADPASAIAIQELRRTQTMLNQAPQPGASNQDRNLTPAQRARKESDERVASILPPPELKPVVNQVGPLKMNNQPTRVLFETVGKLAGVNVLFDPQYTPPARNFNVELGNSSAVEAFDYLALLTHTFWKTIAGTTIFVTDENPTKRRDYEDEIVKTFYVTNATTVQEFQEIATAVRTLTDIRRVFTYNAQKAMVVRGAADAVGLAEKLIHDLDKAKSEVVIDVVVMQANSEHTRNLAATIANANVAGLNVPVAFTPANGVTTTENGANGASGAVGTPTTPTSSSNAVTLGRLAHLSINDFSTTLPGALLTALMTDNRTKVVNSPQLRASDGAKATLKIGQRIPYATGSFQPGVGTVGVSPLVSTQFNYADVGVNLEITPQVHSTEEVTLHIEVEVSSVAQYINLGGIQQPVIGQNKNVADLRLREGEVNILGGLQQSSDGSTLNGIPGITQVPVLGKFLMGQSTRDKIQGELLIALVPHIVRTPDYTPENLRGIYAGNDQVVKLNYASRQENSAPAAAPGATATPPGTVTPPGAAAPAAPAPAAPAPAAPAAEAAKPPIAPPAVPGQATVTFSPQTIQTAVSSPVILTLQANNISDLFAASSIKIKYDPAQLRLNDISAGDLWTRDGVQINAVKDIRNDAGEATLTIARAPNALAISGSGAIATLNFVAVGRGTGTVSAAESSLRNGQQQPLPVTLGAVSVTVH
jgi:general secretion pathway protein D